MKFAAIAALLAVGCTQKIGTESEDTSPISPDPEGRLSAGHSHSCTLTKNNEISCWGVSEGDWDYGQVHDAPSGEFFQIGAAGYFSCALQMDGDPLCWGEEFDGPHGTGIELAAMNIGVAHMCGLEFDGTAHCWGDNQHGQSEPPEQRFIQISAGYNHTCGITASGSTVCWGRDEEDQATPPDNELVQVSAGALMSCGITDTRSAICWGAVLGDIPDVRFKQVSTARSGSHACGVDSDSNVRCWGFDDFGQADELREGPFAAVSAGGTNSCGLLENGRVECWGNNNYGQSSPPAELNE
jgi:alpha-tubulin suppressor-like RCC1 family protein